MDCPPRLVNAYHRRRPLARQALVALVLALPILALPGCSFFQQVPVQRGNRVTEDQLREITVGVQTKKDVEALIGSPTQTSTFGTDIWYYISAKTRIRPGRQLALTDQETLVITFDDKGVVKTIRRVGEDEMKPVEMVSRETPTPGSERSFLQALFGNIGRVGPGATTGPGAAGNSQNTNPGPAPLR